MAAKNSFFYFNKAAGKFYAELITPAGRTRKSLKTAHPKEAEENFRKLIQYSRVDDDEKLLHEMARLNRVRAAAQEVNFVQAWTLFVNSPARAQCGAVTLKSYRAIFDEWARWCVSNGIGVKAKPAQGSRYFAELWDEGRQIAARTYNAKRQGLTHVYKILRAEEVVLEDPFVRILPKPNSTQSKKDFTLEEVKRIFEIFETQKFPYHDEVRLLFLIGCWTGKRLSDAVFTPIEEFDLKKKTITYLPNKTKKSNKTIVLPLKEELYLAVLDYPKPANGYIFPNLAKLGDRDMASISRICTEVFTAAGFVTTRKVDGRKKAVVDYGFHSFRHTLISFCAAAGVPEPVTREIVGHGSPAMTRHYTHIHEPSLRKAIDSLSPILS